MPHHGSETASTEAFIEAVDPRIVIISSSDRHDLPRTTVLARYDKGKRTVFRTDRQDGYNNDHIVCESVEGRLVCKFAKDNE